MFSNCSCLITFPHIPQRKKSIVFTPNLCKEKMFLSIVNFLLLQYKQAENRKSHLFNTLHLYLLKED